MFVPGIRESPGGTSVPKLQIEMVQQSYPSRPFFCGAGLPRQKLVGIWSMDTHPVSQAHTPLLVEHQVQFVLSFLLRLMSPPFNEVRRSAGAAVSLRKLCKKCVELVQHVVTLWADTLRTQLEFDAVLRLMQVQCAYREGGFKGWLVTM